jgi:hypothetical protein
MARYGYSTLKLHYESYINRQIPPFYFLIPTDYYEIDELLL